MKLCEDDLPQILRDWLNERGYMAAYLRYCHDINFTREFVKFYDKLSPEFWVFHQTEYWDGYIDWTMTTEWKDYYESL